MKSIHCFILLFLILSCITTFSYAQEHDHEHEHEVTNNSTQPVTTPKPTSTSTLTPTPMPDNHEGHNHTEAETGHEGHNHAEGEAGNNHAEGGVAGGHEGHNHAEEEAGGHAGHSHASGFDEETCAVEAHQEYNLNFRIGSLFIILATSAVGIFAPILLHQIKPYEENSLRAWILTIGKFFGTGIILSTAFVHMLPEAMERFSSPCLSEGWHSYHSFGAIFCMAAAFILQWIELAALSHMDALKAKKQQQQTESTIAENKLEHGENGHIHSAGFLENDQEDLSLRSISTLLLEFGIAVHSIIIGVTLGTSSETTFIVIFIALIFHQFFEGIALGTRINETNVKGSWIKPLIMGLIFICMTPIGIGIGIGVRTTMDVQSLLVSQAILDSISAGILLYNAYVSLMSVEISHSAKFRQYSFGKKSVCLISMYIGAAIMSVLGLWA